MWAAVTAAVVCVVMATQATMTIYAANDGTMRPNATGYSVVDQTIQMIRTTCIFEDDKLFMRRVAYVETLDGTADGSFRDDYHGGIWKVDEFMFNTLKTSANKAALAKYTNQFLPKLGINWDSTIWSDCRKARVSALAARLYIQTLNPRSTTSDIAKQAAFWSTKYRLGGNATDFEDAAKKLDEGCDRGVDLAFVLDTSSSVGSTNFYKMKQFAMDVVRQFDIASNQTRVSVISYSTSIYTEFFLNRYTNKASVLSHINNMRYRSGGTNTHLALAHLYDQIFTPVRGARDSTVPKFTIFLTDGASANPPMTIVEADKVHAKGIIMFAVGIAGAVMKELKAIASEPECLYMLMLENFNDMDSLKDSILKSACDAPVVIGPGTEGSNGTAKIKKGTDQNCQMKVGEGGMTVKINVSTGGVTFFMSYNTYPSEAYYDERMEAVPGVPGVMYVKRPPFGNDEETVFCNIKGDELEDTDFVYGSEVNDTDYCQSNECKNGATCVDNMNNGYQCACASEYEGKLCSERVKYDCINKSPCTNENVDALRYFFPHYDVTKFVQCDHLTCYVHDCPPDTIFDPDFDVVACVHV